MLPRNTLAKANEQRDWRIYRDFGQAGIKIIKLTGVKPSKCYPETLRMVTYEDFATGKVYRFLTNHWGYEALTIAELYRERWNVELSICVI